MESLIKDIKQFAQERDWEQYHSPRNLIMALSVEVGEVMEHFLWLTGEQSRNLPPEKKAVIVVDASSNATVSYRSVIVRPGNFTATSNAASPHGTATKPEINRKAT